MFMSAGKLEKGSMLDANVYLPIGFQASIDNSGRGKPRPVLAGISVTFLDVFLTLLDSYTQRINSHTM